MKWYLLSLLMFLGITVSVNAQDVDDDDMYFVSAKKKTAKKAVSKSAYQNVVPQKVVEQKVVIPVQGNNGDVDFHTGQLRDVDDYNRRTKMGEPTFMVKKKTERTVITTMTITTRMIIPTLPVWVVITAYIL